MTYSSDMTYHIVAYGMKDRLPPKERPYIPELLIIQDENNGLLQIEREAETKLKFIKFQGPLINEEFEICKPEEWETGKWLAVEKDKIIQFHPTNENNWKRERAEQLIKDSKKYKDPVERLDALTVAANLMNLDIDTLVQGLESRRINPDESLADIYKRTK